MKALSRSLDKQYQKQLVPAKNTVEKQVSISKKTSESKCKKKAPKDKLGKATLVKKNPLLNKKRIRRKDPSEVLKAG